ncbi:Uncharacterised protein [BD1-7 clade bacterium]|uniref:Uncharacterized protein n=1 Tax=BD1-7 clade bacterium TaxID=2029982 RepID=A0A5S9PYD1_9GAMM|nr:Uncharacterised protein [BD1-7 clade bacterium]
MNKAISGILLAAACFTGCKPVDVETIINNPNQHASLVFPSASSFSDQPNLQVRGYANDNVTAVTVNGIAADVDLQTNRWVANVALSEGDNPLNMTATISGRTYSLDGYDVVITRGQPAVQRISHLMAYDNAIDSFYFVDTQLGAVYQVDAQTRARRVLVQLKNIEDVDGSYIGGLVGPLALSEDGQTLYVIAEGRKNDQLLLTVAVDTAKVEIEIGEMHPDYNTLDDHFTNAMALAPRRGAQGQLLFGTDSSNGYVLLYDIASRELDRLSIERVNTITGQSNSEPAWVVMKDANTLLLAGDHQSDFFTVDVDLSSCDGQIDCTLTTSNLRTSFDGAACAGARNRREMAFHSDALAAVYLTGDKACGLDLTTGVISEFLTTETVLVDETDEFGIAGNALYMNGRSDFEYQTFSVNLPADFLVNGHGMSQVFFETPSFGDPAVSVSTPREVVVDDATETVYWIDRGQDKVYQLKGNDWSLFADVNTSNSLEESVFNPVEKVLYSVNDSGNNEVLRYDAETGAESELFGQNLPYNRYEAIALDVDRQLLYVAHEYNSVPVGFGRMSLLVWDIADSQMREVAPITSDIEFIDIRVSYDMSYDDENRRVLFYSSSDGNPIVAIDVDTGERSILSSDAMFKDALSTSNARGQALDASNNRLLITSQSNQHVYAVDLDDGTRSPLSEPIATFGPLMWQPKGISLLDDKQLVYVTDERRDALFQVDLTTGYRVLVHDN